MCGEAYLVSYFTDLRHETTIFYSEQEIYTGQTCMEKEMRIFFFENLVPLFIAVY